jgi:uncharacterized protein YbaR (Trm112 family)/SAM-dependent methyltransferase
MGAPDDSSAPRLLAHAGGARRVLQSAVREARGMGEELGRLPAERRLARPDPPATGLVLDLGGGHDPFPRSDAVVDKYVADDFEREGAIARDRPLIVADGQALPFRDGSIAYVISSHVLEHATDPEAFAAEVSRVADAGFVQLPTSVGERVMGWPFHPWFVERDGDTLIFAPKASAEAEWEGLHGLYDRSALFRLMFFARRSTFHHSVHWRGRLSVRVHGTSRAQRTAEFDLEGTIEALRTSPAPPLTPELRAALCCPLCGTALRDVSGALHCAGCARSYPVEGNVPLLLEEAAGAFVSA